jgi:hypothetical protein
MHRVDLREGILLTEINFFNLGTCKRLTHAIQEAFDIGGRRTCDRIGFIEHCRPINHVTPLSG